jgi:hypothetical protein
MGTSDGVTMVAETGIMQRRTPDAVRSRVMAGFEAVVSFGLAAAYLMAGPVLRALGPQATYRLGGVSALAAACLLLPMLALRRTPGGPSDGALAGAREEPANQEDALGEVLTGSPRYTSAEALESEPLELEPFELEPFELEPDRRSA